MRLMSALLIGKNRGNLIEIEKGLVSKKSTALGPGNTIIKRSEI
jgi:hypothetical protein